MRFYEIGSLFRCSKLTDELKLVLVWIFKVFVVLIIIRWRKRSVKMCCLLLILYSNVCPSSLAVTSIKISIHAGYLCCLVYLSVMSMNRWCWLCAYSCWSYVKWRKKIVWANRMKHISLITREREKKRTNQFYCASFIFTCHFCTFSASHQHTN